MNWTSAATLAAALQAVTSIIDSHILSKRMPGLQVFLLLSGITLFTAGLLVSLIYPFPASVSLLPTLAAIAGALIRTVGLVITFYNAKQKIGALAHTMLPSSKRDTADCSGKDTRYIGIAINEMLRKMELQGIKRQDIEAKLIGGANMFSAFKSSISEDNISCAREELKKEGIKLAGECIGGSQGRSVEFSVASGIVTVKTKF